MYDYVAIPLVHWLLWSWYFLSAYDVIDFLQVRMRYPLKKLNLHSGGWNQGPLDTAAT
jgi:hypothetical protein